MSRRGLSDEEYEAIHGHPRVGADHFEAHNGDDEPPPGYEPREPSPEAGGLPAGGPSHDTRYDEAQAACAEPGCTTGFPHRHVHDPAFVAALTADRAAPRTVGLTFDAPQGRAEPRPNATVSPLPAHAAAAQAALDAIRLIGLGDAVLPDGRVGNGYAAPYGAGNARHADLGMSPTPTWPDVHGGFATAQPNEYLVAETARLTARAAAALVHAAYLIELREYRLIEAAREEGRATGRAAGGWAADGNTDAKAAAAVAARYDAGEDVDEFLPARPNLSGEWADDETPTSLARSLGLEPDDEALELIDALSEAWEAGVDETFEAACLDEIRKAAQR